MTSTANVASIPAFVSTRTRAPESVKPPAFQTTPATNPSSASSKPASDEGDELLGRLRQQLIQSADPADSHGHAERPERRPDTDAYAPQKPKRRHIATA
jgi:hypothetical protein